MHRILMVLGLSLLMISPSWARWKLDKKNFNQSVQQKESTLPLRGVGVKTLFMMRLFVAALYLDPQVKAQDALNDVPKHLEVKFFTTIPGSEFAKFTIKTMKNNTTKSEFKQIADRFKLMEELFPSIKNGDVFSLTYKPGAGTVFTLNGVERGVVPGADFGKAIFATWLGARPIDNILKRQVLGLSK